MGKFDRQFEGDGYSDNPFYSPDKNGLELLYTAEGDIPYEFSILAVFRDVATGAYFAAYDSGCSCPTPFEGVTGLDGMTRIKKIKDFDNFVKDGFYEIDYFDIRKIRRGLDKHLKSS